MALRVYIHNADFRKKCTSRHTEAGGRNMLNLSHRFRNGMTERPELDRKLDSRTFRDHYYLKEELILFCRQNGLRTSGGKDVLTNRVAHYLDTGEELTEKAIPRPKKQTGIITEATVIVMNVSFSEELRTFFERTVGSNFSFNVAFQKWLRSNAGKSYGDAVDAYRSISKEKKRTVIEKQFKYNTYIRDFFDDNQGMKLADAIICWNYKKSQRGNNRYEKDDLKALTQNNRNDRP